MSPKWREHFRKPGKPKKSFEDWTSAEVFARRNKIDFYQCTHCGKFHVGGNNHGSKEG
jgi:hypothetical protein